MNICPNCFSETFTIESGGGSEYKCPHCDFVTENPMTEYSVIDIDTSKIYSDAEFNCRGTITPIDVMDLVNDIREHGLQFPIAVQPMSDVANPTEGFDFRIIAGHRRFQAIKILKFNTVPAMIKVGLTEISARLLNLGENLKREDLNIMQEARAIEHLRRLGMNRRMVSEKLGKSIGWAQVRFNLLDMPEDIQEEAAAGMLNQAQIKEIYSLDTKEKQYEAVRKIKTAKLKGQKGISVGKKPHEDPFKKKRQPKNMVQGMIEHLGSSIGFGLHTRVLAWANGEVSTAELYVDIKEYAVDHEINYLPPVPLEVL